MLPPERREAEIRKLRARVDAYEKDYQEMESRASDLSMHLFQESGLRIIAEKEDGAKRMADIMQSLRSDPPKDIGGIAVSGWEDYLDGTVYEGDPVSEMELRGSNVLLYRLETGEKLVVRPSGTEPKIKIYALMRGESGEAADARAADCAKAAEELFLAR